MKATFKTSLLLLVTILATNCAPPPRVTPVARVVEKERIVNKSFDAVWQSTIEWFATHNTPIKNLDKSSGLVSTEYSLSMAEAANYMDCGGSTISAFGANTRLENHSGNFNVLLKKIDDTHTKINVNVFFGCTLNTYNYKGLLSTEMILTGSKRINCYSTGALEKQVLDFLEAAN
ncbi:MAG: hypothetical protein KGZ87_04650 [Bacteroidetes bacterium]|jgi:hypothetical protein|nr:hypothetical protein [Bacteroidota bacterium]